MSDTALDTAPATVTRNHLPFEVDGGIASRAAIGVIVLASDYTIEHEFRAMLDIPGVAFYQSRIRNDPKITPATLKAMEARIADCADVILPGTPLDVVAFGCTSASMVIGEEGVFARIRSVRPEAAATTPITAAFAAFDALKAKRIAVLTPYRDDVNQVVKNYIEGRGYEVAVMGSFNEENDPVVSRITPASSPARSRKSPGSPTSTRSSSPAPACASPTPRPTSRPASASR